MSSSPSAPNTNPMDKGSGQTDSDSNTSTGDNLVGDPGSSCTNGNQTAVSQQQSSRQNKVSPRCDFSYGRSPQTQAKYEPRLGSLPKRNDDDKVKEADQEGGYNCEGGAQSGYTPVTGPPRTRVFDRVLERSHTVDNQTIDAGLVHELIGDSGEDGPKFKIPDSIVITDVDPRKIQFLQHSETNKNGLEKQLSSQYTRILWPKNFGDPVRLECLLTTEVKDCWTLVNTWKATARSSLDKFLDVLLVFTHTIFQEAWSGVMEQIQTMNVSHPDGVLVAVKRDRFEIFVLGYTKFATELSKNIEKIITDITNAFEGKKQQIRETPPALEHHQKQRQDQLTHSITFPGTTPPPCRKKTETETSRIPDVRAAQIDHSTTLGKTEYEENRLVVRSNTSSTLYKGRIEDWLKETDIKQFKVVCPFLESREALIILQCLNDAENLQKQRSPHYAVEQFPCQSVQNLKATVKESIAKAISSLLKPDDIASAIHDASGATWTTDQNGTCFLEGSLPEIHCANKYIVSIVTDGNGPNWDRSGSHTGRIGALHGDTMEDDIPGYRGNEQNWGPEADDPGIRLVGKKFDKVERVEHMLLKGVGRPCNQTDQQLAKTRRRHGKSPPFGSEVFQTKDGVQVFVYEGDLLDMDVNAIIHGTNTNLINSYGLSAEIAKAAGPDLENACTNVFLERSLNVGDCCCTTAGDLHYEYIIHVVTPMWSAYRKTGTDQGTRKKLYQDDLCRTIMNALEEAVNVAARSVALPVTDFTGYAQCPSDVLTAAFSEAVQLSCDKYKKSSLKEVHIVDQNTDILKKIKDELLQAKELNNTTPPVTE
ncbi:uncharacterized protein LOC117339941 isoform X2 [Pecten maximus]|uniref:uncharacterized protein LOC117339941 isoform X2 n=1 Tax=Pecten maximus TaxID=6579 RepID=UPI001458DB7D|nr:uncharacterized protein LOC117339941 isoform X2 [Pecten maximus]